MLANITLDHGLVVLFFLYLFRQSFKKTNTSEGINSYAIGNRTFSTFALATTITATWVSGSGLVLDLSEFHSEGITYFIASLGMCLTAAIVGYYIVPRSASFLGKTSVAAIMGEHYGQSSRHITSFLGSITSCGGIAIQFKIMGDVLHILFPEVALELCMFFSAAIVTFYTYSGGIRAVVKTDITQAICFSLSLVVAISMFDTELNFSKISTAVTNKFQISYLFSLDTTQQIDLLLLFCYFLTPDLKPHLIQRISMGVNIEQVKKAYLYSAVALVAVLILSCWVSYLIYQIDPTIQKNEILGFLIDKYTIPGTKGILVIGIIAMCMSTADSKLNISAVLIANDFYFFHKNNSLQKMYNARRFTILIGAISFFISVKFKDNSLLDIILMTASLYTPAITVPLMMMIFKFKFTERSVLISMVAGLSFVVIFKWILRIELNIICIAMLVNLIALVSSHYIIEKWELLKCFGIRSRIESIGKEA